MLKRFAATLVLVLALGGGTSKAEEALISFKVLSPAVALELALATLEACRNEGYQVSVAVVDRFGITQVILRDRYAGVHTPETARRKAWTAVSFRTDTATMAELTQAGQSLSAVRFVTDAFMGGGGVPVEAAGSLVGGIGVSGAPGGPADDACARAGIEAIEDKIAF
jgi:uncharacterized protein GlcG (DUF336 family)